MNDPIIFILVIALIALVVGAWGVWCARQERKEGYPPIWAGTDRTNPIGRVTSTEIDAEGNLIASMEITDPKIIEYVQKDSMSSLSIDGKDADGWWPEERTLEGTKVRHPTAHEQMPLGSLWDRPNEPFTGFRTVDMSEWVERRPGQPTYLEPPYDEDPFWEDDFG